MRYLIRATINDTNPEVWRLLVVPGRTRLPGLHAILQAAFGWWDYHLYSFRVGATDYVLDDEDLEWAGDKARVIDGRALSTILGSRKKLTYQYDFGDRWVVTLQIVGRAPDTEQWRELIELVDGERNGPPEDVGGPGGFAAYLATMAGPDTPERCEWLEWGGEYDPEDAGLDGFVTRLVDIEGATALLKT